MNESPTDFGIPESDDPHTPAPIIRPVKAPARQERASELGRPLPYSEEGEQYLIAAALLDGIETLSRCKDAGIYPDSFHLPANRVIWQAMLRLQAAAKPVSLEVLFEELSADGLLEPIGGLPYLSSVTSKIPTTAHTGYFIDKVRQAAGKRDIIRKATELVEHAHNGTELPELIQDAKNFIDVLATGSNAPSKKDKLARLQAREVFGSKPQPEPITRLSLAGKPVATPGNLVTLIAKAKTGKTAALGGATAAIIAAAAGRKDFDTLGFESPDPQGKALIIIDTEQSQYDAYVCYQRALARISDDPQSPPSDPHWVHHYALVGASVQELKDALLLAIETHAVTHKGIFQIILDGVADFVASVNDEGECNAFVTWIRSIAVQYDCPIICVIHSNEAQKSGDDGRGHLGKQLTRKAESNLLLKKIGDVTTITSEKQRKAPITLEDGIAFKWDDASGRHISCGTPADGIKAEKRSEAADLARACFAEKGTLKWADLRDIIMSSRDLSKNTAERRINDMKRLGVISSTFSGSYTLST